MRVPWKYVGLAGMAGVAATGVVVARRGRVQHAYDPDELRDRLHHRLADVPAAVAPSAAAATSPPEAEQSS